MTLSVELSTHELADVLAYVRQELAEGRDLSLPFPDADCLMARLEGLEETAADLLALAHKYASECGMCGGTNRDPWNSPNGKPCDVCAPIHAVIAKAEGRS